MRLLAINILVVIIILFFSGVSEDVDQISKMRTINKTQLHFDSLKIYFDYGIIEPYTYYNISPNDTTFVETLINAPARVNYKLYIDSTLHYARVYCGCGSPATEYVYLHGGYAFFVHERDSDNSFFPVSFIRDNIYY